MTYLLWPLLGLLMVGLGVFIAKKNALLSNKHLIGYTIGTILVLTTPALLGFLGFDFMPKGYIFLMMIYLVLGWYNTRLMSWIFQKEFKYRHELFLTLFVLIVAMLFFVLLFNLCNDLQYGLWACTTMLPFIFVSLFVQSYHLFLDIPEPIYKMWRYNNSENIDMYDKVDFGALKVVTLEIYKNEGDAKPLQLKGKLPDELPFGVWLRQLIDDYNKKMPLAPIQYRNQEEEDVWIFYRHNSLFLPKKYIDYEITSKENKIKDNSFIVAKRIKEYKIEDK
ncbi:MAG: TssN family type VI secretion system protein [Oscillospiraceae bacterium]